jgi:hypothetical protein
MRRTAVSAAVISLAFLVVGGLALGQKEAADREKPRPPTAPSSKAKGDKKTASSLADLLAEALRNNPDLRVAEAKLQEAQAEVTRARHLVVKRISTLYHAIETQKSQVAFAEKQLNRFLGLEKNKAITQELVDEQKLKLVVEKTKLAELEAEMPYLLGKQPIKMAEADKEALLYFRSVELAQREWMEDRARNTDAAVRKGVEWLKKTSDGGVQPIRGDRAEKLRKALDAPVAVKAERGMPLGEVLDFLEDRVPGLSFRVVSGKRGEIRNEPIDLNLKDVSVGAALQAIQDTIPRLRFAVREYGLLVTWEDQLPPRAVLVSDFWKGGADKEKPKAKGPTSGKGAEKKP